MRGRYSHVAAAMEGRVLLVAGGYSGVARGDLVAYKVPLFVNSDQGDRVSELEVETKKGNHVFRMTAKLTCEETNGRDSDEVVCVCVLLYQDAFCAEALDESMCLKNPECSWCEGRCREYQPTNPVKCPFAEACGCYVFDHIMSRS